MSTWAACGKPRQRLATSRRRYVNPHWSHRCIGEREHRQREELPDLKCEMHLQGEMISSSDARGTTW
jgi:hypothetical protein